MSSSQPDFEVDDSADASMYLSFLSDSPIRRNSDYRDKDNFKETMGRSSVLEYEGLDGIFPRLPETTNAPSYNYNIYTTRRSFTNSLQPEYEAVLPSSKTNDFIRNENGLQIENESQWHVGSEDANFLLPVTEESENISNADSGEGLLCNYPYTKGASTFLSQNLMKSSLNKTSHNAQNIRVKALAKGLQLKVAAEGNVNAEKDFSKKKLISAKTRSRLQDSKDKLTVNHTNMKFIKKDASTSKLEQNTAYDSDVLSSDVKRTSVSSSKFKPTTRTTKSIKTIKAKSAERKSLPTPLKSRTSMAIPTMTSDKHTHGLRRQTSAVVKTTPSSVRRNISQEKMVRSTILVTQAPSLTNTSFKSLSPEMASTKKFMDPPFVCDTCNAQFRVKSLYDGHKLLHDNRKHAKVKAVTNNSFQCSFCDRAFALERTLHIHHMQYCKKIPASEKRKLEYTEMDHVDKPQLPDCFQACSSNMNTKIPNVVKPVAKNNISLKNFVLTRNGLSPV